MKPIQLTTSKVQETKRKSWVVRSREATLRAVYRALLQVEFV